MATTKHRIPVDRAALEEMMGGALDLSRIDAVMAQYAPAFSVITSWTSGSIGNCGVGVINGCTLSTQQGYLVPAKPIPANVPPILYNTGNSVAVLDRYVGTYRITPPKGIDQKFYPATSVLYDKMIKEMDAQNTALFILSDPAMAKGGHGQNVYRFMKYCETHKKGLVFKFPFVVNLAHTSTDYVHASQVFGWVPPSHVGAAFEPERIMNPRVPKLPSMWAPEDPRVRFFAEEGKKFNLTYEQLFGIP